MVFSFEEATFQVRSLHCPASFHPPSCSMSDKSELKAELERKKQRIAQIREEKKRKEEEKKKKDVCVRNNNFNTFNYIP